MNDKFNILARFAYSVQLIPDFLEAEEHAKLGYVVNTTNCRILNISAWDTSLISVISSYLKPPVNCSAQIKKWTYVEGQVAICLFFSNGFTIYTMTLQFAYFAY